MRTFLIGLSLLLLTGCGSTYSYHPQHVAWDAMSYGDPYTKMNYGSMRSLTTGIR